MAEDITTRILEIQVKYETALKQIAQYRAEVEKAQNEQKKLREQLKEGSISSEQYGKAMEASKMAVMQNNTAIMALTRQVQNQMKAEKEEEGSLTSLRAKLSTLTAEYDRLSKKEREGEKGLQLKEAINETTATLKDAEEATQRFFRNVGNYPDTIKPLADQLNVLTARLDEMKQAGNAAGPEFDNLVKQIEQLEQVLDNAENGDSITLSGVLDGVNSVASAFVVWTSILDRAGIKNEALSNALTALMTATAAYSAINKAAAAVEQNQAVMKAITAAKTWLLVQAKGADSVATSTLANAEAGATRSTWAFNAALAACPLVWVVAAVTAVIGIIYGLTKAFDALFGASKSATEELERGIQAYERMKKANENLIHVLEMSGTSSTKITEQKMKNANDELAALERVYDYAVQKNADEEVIAEAKEKLDEARLNALNEYESAYFNFSKIIKEENDYQLEQEKGKYEAKRILVDREIDDQIRLLQTLKVVAQQRGYSYAQYDQMMIALEQRRKRLKDNVDKEEKKDNEQKATAARNAAKTASDNAKKRQDEQTKAADKLVEETRKAEDMMTDLIKDNLEKQRKAEEASYARQLKASQDKLALYIKNTQYDIQMREAINAQIEALELKHQQTLQKISWEETDKRIKMEQELLKGKLDAVVKGSELEKQTRLDLLGSQFDAEMEALERRLENEEITYAEYFEKIQYMTIKFQKDQAANNDEYAQKKLSDLKQVLQNEIDQMQLAEDERQLKIVEGYQLSDEQYAQWREAGLAQMEEHQAAILLKQEENAQVEYDALMARGQLSTQTAEEFAAEQIAAKQKIADASANINAAIVANEQAKTQAMKSLTSSLTGLLDVLGEKNKAFAIMSKVITLAQIAIDTGKALSAGIASASSVPFPGNIAAIATTVATVLANVTTAITTVKGAKFAKGGKVTGAGTGTSDSIPAMLSNGEFVMTAKATKVFEPLLMAMNNIGSGTPIQVANSYENVSDAEMMTESFERAAREIKPVVSVVEITEAQDRVSMIENLDNF